MNTTLPLPAQPIFQRFLWKEYRMLRGFWLAVGVLAVIVQWVLPHLQYDARSVPAQLFAVAWGAAALYAIGAAITLFSAEREERTHDFLRVLPDRWLPMFVGKVLLGLLSAVALASVLSLTGWLLANFSWPAEAARRETLAVVGVAIIEASAWGLLFSLWMKQPLLAAILSIAAASFGAQLAVIVASPNDPTAYSQAVSMRLFLCFGVFLVDLWLASRWLHPAPSKKPFKRRRATAPDATNLLQAQVSTAKSQAATRPRRRRMFASLLWQTWRESWKTMLAAVPIALLLIVAINATSWFSKTEALSMFLCPLLLPALFGALVFRADQRRGHRQFLVAHAGRPRYVWFARQAVWLSTLVAIGCVFYFVAVGLTGLKIQEFMQQRWKYEMYAGGYQQTAWSTATQIIEALSTFWSFTSVGWCALLAAYGLGQLCSMLLSREVLAGFLALLLAGVLTAWAIVVGVWELNPSWYVLPIGVVAMAATWLRAPDWIVGRNSLRAWLAPVLAIVVPLGLIFSTLPQARLDQIALPPTSQLYNYLQEPLEDSLRELDASQATARETATAYERLHATLVSFDEATKDVRVDGKRYEDLDILQDDFGYGGLSGELSSPEDLELLARFAKAKQLAYAIANQEAIAELETLSRKPACQFPVEVALGGNRKWNEVYHLKHLLLNDALRQEANDQLQDALARFLTFARIDGQILSAQPTLIAKTFFDQMLRARELDEAVLRWAQHPDQTSKNLIEAIHDLQEVYQNYPKLREAVLADHLLIRDVLLEKEPASFFSNEHKSWSDYLPFMANKLSWERERALRALDIVTGSRLNYMDVAAYLLAGGELQQSSSHERFSLSQILRHTNRQPDEIVNESVYVGDWDAYYAAQKYQHLCRTSYLVDDELRCRVDTPRFLIAAIDAEIARRGLLTQLALLAYRLDHDAYPKHLEELAPEYLAEVPLDPYSQEPFEYRAAGLDLPLLRHNWSRIAAKTPLFWSVGSSNQVLEQHLQDRANEEGDDQASGQNEPIYRFRPTPYFHWSQSLVFPLPR